MNFIILTGVSASGKTNYAKRLEQDGYYYVSWDAIFNYKITRNNVYNTLKKLKEIVRGKDKVVIDGYCHVFDKKLRWFKGYMKGKVKVKMMIAPVRVIMNRRVNSMRQDWDVDKIYREYFNDYIPSLDKFELIDTTDMDYKIVNESLKSYWKKINIPPKKPFKLENPDGKYGKYDIKYQDIELHPYYLKGYTDSEYSWIRIKNMVDFEGKNVLDVGCFHGFYSFKAEEAGAASVIGLEPHKDAIETAKRIRDYKQSSVSFWNNSIENSWTGRDITLALNMIHHTTDKNRAWQHILTGTNEVILEIRSDEDINYWIKKYDFYIEQEVISHRVDSDTGKPRRLIKLSKFYSKI